MKPSVLKERIYAYPAIFNYANDGISVSFPDLPGCFSCGQNDEEARRMAKDALSGHLMCMLEDGDVIPELTPVDRIAARANERAVLITL